MKNYSYIFCGDSLSLINLVTGNTTTVFSDNPKYDDIKMLIVSGDYADAERLADVKVAVEKFVQETEDTTLCLYITGSRAEYSWGGAGEKYPLHNALIDRIIQMSEEGLPVQPLVNFMSNLLHNPSKQSVDELYLFLEACKLPITEDGCFIAYKIVKENYKDIYTGKIDNSVGQFPSMPRNLVDARRDNVCSQGLHFCSKDYLDSYGTSNRDADRCMLVKINPADVVSIPSDYNNAKGRVWTYEVVGEMADAQWREILGKKDYTEASVVSSVGEEYVPDTAPRLNQTPTKEGLKWITNGEKNTRIPKGDKIPDGWRYGASYLVISKKDKRKTISVSTPIPKGWKIVKARK